MLADAVADVYWGRLRFSVRRRQVCDLSLNLIFPIRGREQHTRVTLLSAFDPPGIARSGGASRSISIPAHLTGEPVRAARWPIGQHKPFGSVIPDETVTVGGKPSLKRLGSRGAATQFTSYQLGMRPNSPVDTRSGRRRAALAHACVIPIRPGVPRDPHGRRSYRLAKRKAGVPPVKASNTPLAASAAPSPSRGLERLPDR
jgi:hypothetical protein